MSRVLTAFLIVLIASCSGIPSQADPQLLSFVSVPGTTRSEAIERLGQPSATFEHEHILTYRIAGDEKSGYWVRDLQDNWLGTRFSLVLIFDDDGSLVRHSLVPVR